MIEESSDKSKTEESINNEESNNEESNSEESYNGESNNEDSVNVINKDSLKKPSKVLTDTSLSLYHQNIKNSGVIYLSKIPPFMKPIKLKQLLEVYGKIGRVYLAQEANAISKKRIKYRGNKRTNYTEGWVEFLDKKVARATAEMLNANIIGGKKRSFYHDDIWNMKYLPKFKWDYLTEQIAYENAVKDQKLRQETILAKNESKGYLANVAKAKMIDNIEAKNLKKRKALNLDDAVDSVTTKEEFPKQNQTLNVKRVFKQRKVVHQPESSTSLLHSNVLKKIFSK